MKLKNKIFLYTTFLFITIIIILSLTIYFTFTDITYDREMERIESDTENILSGLQEANEFFSFEDILGVYVPSNGMARIVNSEGNLITAVASGEVTSNIHFTFERGRQSEIISHQDTKYGVIQVPAIWSDGQVVYLQVFESLELVEDNLMTLRLVLTLVTVIAIIPIIVSGKLLSDLIIRPIQSLIQTMNDIKSSHTFKHIPLNKHSNDELFTMSQTFNELMDLLKENYEKQEAFVSNASHELRTPITIIESYANLIKRRGLERPELIKESIEAIHSESLRMKDLTEQLLLLVNRDKDWVLEIEDVQINQVVEQVSDNFDRAYKRDIQIDAKEDITIQTDEQKLKQLLYIFLDNARKYSDDLIKVEVMHVSQKPAIKITDYGIGIPKSAQSRVFDRFYRVDEARNRDEGGTGLGLTVARELAEAIQVDIQVDSQENVGTTVILTINSLDSH
ncbi:sensor histidine kinase [Tenuibacillus multivorans]|uniref:Signal transduction histidine-protein kinase ArlS n=1 Tax=Tenuibacillus multivorans TaxID=237069 RepID=A0A1G9YF53_9BACI|nr:HAMP domain-containing sensor histidine kinase [Tenuibacillus multivorans]GEL78541.1 sensor histidine kinase YkoH [Tenuibacillus multivorans]SDN07682.1 Signal transduction histidine kinase [Tenuibacillus multivorans]